MSALRTLLLTLIMLPSIAFAADSAAYVEGKDYDLLEEVIPARDPQKIEVVELFWYGCGHCFHFESMIQAWKKTLAADVDFWQSPAMWSQDMRIHARAFYTAEALGVSDKLNEVLFNALNVDRKELRNEAELEALFVSQGVKAEDFAKAFNSFSVASKVKQADARARAYKISGTPEVIVAGKYRVTGKVAGGQPEMIKVMNYLIDKERRSRAAK
jgi:thiol:disulfide interchange protein DsbA